MDIMAERKLSDVQTENESLRAKVAEKEALLTEWERERVRCSYCGYTGDSSEMDVHVMGCEMRPTKKLEAQVKTLSARVQELEAQLAEARRGAPLNRREPGEAPLVRNLKALRGCIQEANNLVEMMTNPAGRSSESVGRVCPACGGSGVRSNDL